MLPMSSISRGEYYGGSYTLQGVSVRGRGVFRPAAPDPHRPALCYHYIGQCQNGHACGLGVVASQGNTEYADHGPDGRFDGRHLFRYTIGTSRFSIFDRGNRIEFGHVDPGHAHLYNGEVCAPDDPRLLALVARVGPVEVRPSGPFPPIGPIAYPLAPRHSPPGTRPTV